MAALNALQVLLVDDNQHMRAIVAAVLKAAGVKRIREARDGSEALQVLARWQADVVITDFNMAPMDGVEFTRTLRTDPASPNPFLPVIMMTGHSEKSRVEAARDAGVTEFVAKPITARAIFDRLNAVIFRPRPFIQSETYFGPCRRRVNDPDFEGPWRRRDDRLYVSLDEDA
jgi:CheY-like chemotaxis protein